MNKQQTAVKNFLNGAHCINQSIECKLEQIQSLSELATKATSTISDMPGSPNRNIHKIDDLIAKIVDLQAEIKDDAERLVAVREQIRQCINQVTDREGQMILEERYLRNSKWEDIALYTNRSMRQVYRIHDNALKEITVPEKLAVDDST